MVKVPTPCTLPVSALPPPASVLRLPCPRPQSQWYYEPGAQASKAVVHLGPDLRQLFQDVHRFLGGLGDSERILARAPEVAHGCIDGLRLPLDSSALLLAALHCNFYRGMSASGQLGQYRSFVRIVGETKEQTLPRPAETHLKPTNPAQTHPNPGANPLKPISSLAKHGQTHPLP